MSPVLPKDDIEAEEHMEGEYFKDEQDKRAHLIDHAYELGFRDGLTAYSWMKDGTTFVGTCGKTLKEAIARIRKHWNYGDSLHILDEE